MIKKELVMLMTALTKGGKTTIAIAVCNRKFRRRMVALCNYRTQVTVDWTFDPKANKIVLKEIHLNHQGIFGTRIEGNITCDKYNEILDSEDGTYLKNTFGLDSQEELTAKELEDYVESKIASYINECNDEDKCDDNGLTKLIKDRKSNKFIRRIKVLVPPEDEFKKIFEDMNITLVLRDTRGILDIDPEEATKVQYRTMEELGIDGIDSVLLLGTSAPFADTVNWYKNAYKCAFESVPIFIMTRPDSVTTLYDFLYGIDDENVTDGNVEQFLQLAKEGKGKGYKEFRNTYIQCYRLLEMFDIGKLNGIEFQYNYKVYNNEDLCYVYPNSTTLVQNAANPNYDSADYRLYERIVFANLKDMINRMVEHNRFIVAINSQIKSDFLASLQNKSYVPMCPYYQKYSRSEVCAEIKQGPILGPRDGIVTVEHGNVVYLGSVTSGVSARSWLRSNIYNYEYSKALTNPDGSAMIQNMPLECQKNLVRMALFNIVENNTDKQAYFQKHYFIDRYVIQDAIRNLRSNKINGDALNNASMEIAKIIF